MKTYHFLLATGISLALGFTFGCSSGGDGNGNGGDNGGSGVPFNENSQIYYKDGTQYTGSGAIEVGYYAYDEYGNETFINRDLGNVENGIVNLKLSQTVPNGYLRNIFDESSCTDYPKNIKAFGGELVLVDNNKEYIKLRIVDNLEPIEEEIYYMYFSKAGKMTCSSDGFKYNIEAKVGWNKMYCIREEPSECSTNNILTKEVKWIISDLK